MSRHATFVFNPRVRVGRKLIASRVARLVRVRRSNICAICSFMVPKGSPAWVTSDRWYICKRHVPDSTHIKP